MDKIKTQYWIKSEPSGAWEIAEVVPNSDGKSVNVNYHWSVDGTTRTKRFRLDLTGYELLGSGARKICRAEYLAYKL